MSKDPIQHLRVNKDPLIKDQYLLDLGRVNILTGKNSSGKSTVFKSVAEKPNTGATISTAGYFQALVREQFPSKLTPQAQFAADIWIERITAQLDGTMVFANNSEELVSALNALREGTDAAHYEFAPLLHQITRAILEHNVRNAKCAYLSPKRRIPFQALAQTVEQLDIEAQQALSRLFYLKNQPLDERGHRCYELIFHWFQEITGYHFDVLLFAPPNVHGSNSIQLRFRRGGPGAAWINSQDEGQGLSEILTMVLYSLDGDYDLVLIEEPENHLHPDLQRRLISFLNTVEDRQFILSTHSPIFLNRSLVDRIYMCKFQEGKIVVSDTTNRVEALGELGFLVSDNLTSDAIIMTEGKTDWLFLEHIIRKWLAVGNSAAISFFQLNGSMMGSFDPSPFAEVRNTFALLDRDPKNKKPQKDFAEKCTTLGIPVHQLERYSLENYYTIAALQKTFGAMFPSGVTAIKNDIPLWKQLADDKHDEKCWEGELKATRRISKILENMTLKDLEESDLYKFCLNVVSALNLPISTKNG